MPGLDCDIGLGIFAEHAVGKGAEDVGAGANVGDGEFAVFRAIGPELVVVAIVRPGDGGAVAGAELEAAADARIIGVGEADGEVGKQLAGGLGIAEDELSGDGAALGFVGVVHAPDPGEGPCGFDRFRFFDGVLPEGSALSRQTEGTAGLPLPEVAVSLSSRPGWGLWDRRGRS